MTNENVFVFSDDLSQMDVTILGLAEHAARAQWWFLPRQVLRSCGLPQRASKSVLVLTPSDDFHETLRTHEEAKCRCGDRKQ